MVTSRNKLQFVHPDQVSVEQFCYPRMVLLPAFPSGSKSLLFLKNTISSPVSWYGSKLQCTIYKYVFALYIQQ